MPCPPSLSPGGVLQGFPGGESRGCCFSWSWWQLKHHLPRELEGFLLVKSHLLRRSEIFMGGNL